MHVIFSARHGEVSDAVKAYATEKANKLTRYYDRIQEIEVVIGVEKDRHTVEMLVNGEHKNMFVAKEDEAPNPQAGIDGCVEKLKHQLSDLHKRVKNRKHPEQSLPG